MKDSEITSESSRKPSGILSKSCRKHRRNVSVSSRGHCQLSRKHCSGSLRKGACRRRRLRNIQLSSRKLVGCLSSSQNSIVTRSGDLASVQQSPASSHSRRSSEANSANQSSKPSSSSCAKTSAASGTKMKRAVQEYLPLVVDATNISKSKGMKTSIVCSVLDTIMNETSECVETVHELDDYILKVPGRKRRHADSLAPQTAKAKVSDTLATFVHKHKSSRQDDMAAAHEHKQKSLKHKDTLVTRVHKLKCSQHDDDTSSVISLGSDDDEVEIIDSDPKPQLDRSVKTNVDPKPQSVCNSSTDVVIDTSHKSNPETVIIDLCSPSVNSKHPALRQKCVDREDEKTSSSKYTCSERAFKEYVSVLGDGFRTSRNRPYDVPSVSSHAAAHCLAPFASASASWAGASAVNSGVEKMQDCEVVFISSGKGDDKVNSASVCGGSLQKHNHSDVRKRLQAIDNRMDQTSVPSSSAYGSNLYNPHPDTVRMGLRPIVIDGSNVAMG